MKKERDERGKIYLTSFLFIIHSIMIIILKEQGEIGRRVKDMNERTVMLGRQEDEVSVEWEQFAKQAHTRHDEGVGRNAKLLSSGY